MIPKFAEGTGVSPEKSRAEIETMLRRHGADQFVSGWDATKAKIVFRAKNRTIRFELPLPDPKDFGRTEGGRRRAAADAQRRACEAEHRRRWRALALVIKAKLEAVASGVSEFDTEFLPFILLPDGRTVAEHVLPAVAESYRTNTMQTLLQLGEGPGGA